MLRTKSIVGAGIALLAITLSSSRQTNAQSTLFNIPSTDVQAKKKVYLEFDFISHLESHEDGGFRSYAPRVVVGLGNNFEAGVNVSFTDALAPDQPVEIQPNVKYQFYNDEDNGVAAAVGGILYAPIARRAGTDTFGLIYTTVSKKVSGAYGPRLTGGGYGLVGRANGNGSEGGAIVGYEQPLHSKVSFVADWLSGKNRFGYVTPGFAITTSSRSQLYVGYSIGNQGRKNNALFIYHNITF